jgi:uncharacterized protein (DUF1697 family)
MKTYIALLRGVNVGGRAILKMDALRATCTSLGLIDAKTYLQSGNVVFRSSLAAAALTKQLEDELQVKVLLRTPKELEALIDANPFEGAEGNRLNVVFLGGPLSPEAKRILENARAGGERIHHARREIYIHFPNGMGRSKLGEMLTEKKLGVVPTTRNWNTVTALLRLAREAEGER